MASDHFLNLQPGTIVNGRYEVVKCLGTGSMGMVYACRHRELAGHIVAMKVLFPEVARDEVAAARFRNEIVASYGVSHPNVVRAYEYFRDGDLIAFTMEYISGGDIADKISNADRITIDDITRMLTQMCSGVQAIHDAGIIHRDLKPENILLSTQGDIKITDFGIARAGTGPRLTDHGGVVGTIDYVSPEYLERGEVDARSDIYALGVIAYEMITHEPPFKGKSVIETMTLRLRTDPTDPQTLRPDCPPELSAVVLKAMARDPGNRYQTAREMYEDLQLINRARPAKIKSTSAQQGAPSSSSTKNGIKPPRPRQQVESGVSAGAGGEASYGGSAQYAGGMGQAEVSRGGTSGIRKTPSPVKNFIFDSASLLDESDYSSPLESVLSSNRLTARDTMFHAEDNLIPPPTVAISEAHLSSERLKALSEDMNHSGGAAGLVASVVSAIVIFFLGFTVGWLLLKHIKPELFEPSASEPSAISAEKIE